MADVPHTEHGAPLPPKRRRSTCKVERNFRGTRGLTFALLNPWYHGVLCHFDTERRMTYRHIDGEAMCPCCFCGMGTPRWYGFIGGYDEFNKWDTLVVLTQGAVQHCNELRPACSHESLMGFRLWVGRMRDSRRGPLACRLFAPDERTNVATVRTFPLLERVAELFEPIPAWVVEQHKAGMLP